MQSDQRPIYTGSLRSQLSRTDGNLGQTCSCVDSFARGRLWPTDRHQFGDGVWSIECLGSFLSLRCVVCDSFDPSLCYGGDSTHGRSAGSCGTVVRVMIVDHLVAPVADPRG